MDLLPYAFNSLTGEVGKLALTFSRGLPLRELIMELGGHFGIIADLDTLRREFYSMKQGTHETVSQFAVISVCFLLVWFVGCTSCTLQTSYAWLVRSLYLCMVGILIYRILHLSLRCDS